MYKIGDSVKLQLTTQNEEEYGADQLGVVRRVVSVVGNNHDQNVLIGVDPWLPDHVYHWHKATEFVPVGYSLPVSQVIAYRDKYAAMLEESNTMYFQGLVEGLDIAIAILDEYNDQ